jgi:hypothetical protein
MLHDPYFTLKCPALFLLPFPAIGKIQVDY